MVSLMGRNAKWLCTNSFTIRPITYIRADRFWEAFIYFIAFGFLFDGIYSIGEAFKIEYN